MLALGACAGPAAAPGSDLPAEVDAAEVPRAPADAARAVDARPAVDGVAVDGPAHGPPDVAAPGGEPDAAPALPPDAGGVALDARTEPAGPLGPFPLAAIQAAKPEVFVASDARVEGPSWRSTDGSLFFAADGLGLMRADPQGKLYRYYPTLDPVGSFALADGSVLLCEKQHILLQMFPDGKLGIIVGGGGAAGFCNDITVDAEGTIYFSDSRAGAIMRVTPAGVLTRLVGGRSYTNGVEVDRESKYLYFSDTGANMLFRVPLGQDGAAAEKLGSMIADGMAIDAWGNLWLAQVTAGQINVYDPVARKVLATFNAGGPQTTNLTFGGPGHDTLFTTVAKKGIMRLAVGARGFAHPGAAKYALKGMVDLAPANTPVP
jgi:gluconolactonase